MTLTKLIEELQKIKLKNPELSDQEVFHYNDEHDVVLKIKATEIKYVIEDETGFHEAFDENELDDLDDDEIINSSQNIVIFSE